MAYADHIEALNCWNPDNFLPFVVDGIEVGRIRHDFADQLAGFPDCFVVSDKQVLLHSQLTGFEQRSDAVATVLSSLAESGAVTHLIGEMFPVLEAFGKPALLQIDRASVSQFGIRAFGQHLNGYVQTGDGLAMWIARRASDRRAFPGKLDQLVAGGLPHAISLTENLAKECREEADIPPELAAAAEYVGEISYCCEVAKGVRHDTIFCYDLLLPEDFTPRCTDGEVESFALMPIEKVAEIVRDTEDFKPNCNLVVIDFLQRHGFIEADLNPHNATAGQIQVEC